MRRLTCLLACAFIVTACSSPTTTPDNNSSASESTPDTLTWLCDEELRTCSEAPAPDPAPGEASEDRATRVIAGPPGRPCGDIDLDAWNPEDFAFELFHYFSCRRPHDENLLFSPVLAWLTLIEHAQTLSGAEANEIIELLGFSDLASAVAAADELRQELLSRRPIDASGMLQSNLPISEYTIEEDDPDRLVEALGIEFYHPTCADGSCRFAADNGRWTEDILGDLQPRSDAHARAIVVRGQWEYQGARTQIRGYSEFQTSDEKSIPFINQVIDTRQFAPSRQGRRQGRLFEVRLLGGEISLFLLHSTRPPTTIASVFSHARLQTWLESIESVYPAGSPVIGFPPMEITDTLDLGEALRLNSAIETTARTSIDRSGVMSPNPVEPRWERPGNTLHRGLGPDREYFRFTKPFLFFVYDHPTETILLMGRAARPIPTDPTLTDQQRYRPTHTND